MSLADIVEDLAQQGSKKLAGRGGIIVVIWNAAETVYRTNVKPVLVPSIMRSLAHKLAPMDGTSIGVQRPPCAKCGHQEPIEIIPVPADPTTPAS